MSRRFGAVAAEIFEHPIVGVERDRAFTKLEAWLWLVLKAAWKDHVARTSKGLVELKRGDVMAGRDHLATAWRWSVKQVRGYLAALESSEQIKKGQQTANGVSIISICNYEKWQSITGKKDSKGPAEGPAEGQQRASKGANKGPHSKQSKQNNTIVPPNPQGDTGDEDGFAFDEATVDQPSPAPKAKRAPKQNTAPNYTADYLAVWEAFPRNPNSSKVDGFRMWERLDDATKAVIPLAVGRYCRKVSDPKYAKHLSSWLHGRVFDQYLDATATQSPASASKAADAPSRSEWTTSQWHRMLREYAGSEWNTRELGPVPGFRGCQVPPEIISDLDLLEKYTEWGTSRNLHHPTHPARWNERAAA